MDDFPILGMSNPIISQKELSFSPAQEVAEATVLFKPSVGPWLWPLHEPETLMGKISWFYMLKKK